MRRTLLGLALLSGLPVWGGCDSGGGEEGTSSGPAYSAHCEIVIESEGTEAPLRFEGRAELQEAAEQVAWEATCAALELSAGCREALPEGLRSEGIVCTRLTLTGGTGMTAAGPPETTCTVNLMDRRSIQRAEARVERSGSRDELEDYSEVLCAEAIARACGEVGAEGDCTAGEEARFSVVSSAAGRRLGASRE